MTIEQIKFERELRKWTQSQLAPRLGIHPVTLCNYELGVKRCPMAILLACEAIFSGKTDQD